MNMGRLVFLFLMLPLFCYSQINRDSLVNSERTMDRRFTLYKGQMRVEGTYEFFVFKSQYDENGDKVLLSKSGISSNQHTLNANLRYGIIDYLDAELQIKYKSLNYRGEPVFIIGAPSPPLWLYTDISTSGFEDIYLGINGRIPMPNNKIDVGGTLGVYLPTSKSESDQPQHVFTSDASGDVINYFYKENWGYGVLSVYYKIFLKYRLDNFAISGFYESRVPNAESQNLTWYSRLTDSDIFLYSSESYQHQVPQKSNISIQFEYQLYQWINVFLDYSSFRSKGGWVGESGNKVALPDEKLSVINPGYEVLISNKLWLRQGVVLPVSGKNVFASFSIHTTFYYNLFVN